MKKPTGKKSIFYETKIHESKENILFFSESFVDQIEKCTGSATLGHTLQCKICKQTSFAYFLKIKGKTFCISNFQYHYLIPVFGHKITIMNSQANTNINGYFVPKPLFSILDF